MDHGIAHSCATTEISSAVELVYETLFRSLENISFSKVYHQRFCLKKFRIDIKGKEANINVGQLCHFAQHQLVSIVQVRRYISLELSSGNLSIQFIVRPILKTYLGSKAKRAPFAQRKTLPQWIVVDLHSRVCWHNYWGDQVSRFPKGIPLFHGKAERCQ